MNTRECRDTWLSKVLRISGSQVLWCKQDIYSPLRHRNQYRKGDREIVSSNDMQKGVKCCLLGLAQSMQ